jgi:quinol monooxygenase YgiN
MIVRIVKMKFSPDKLKEFSLYFEKIQHQIRNFEGCTHLELWQATKESNLLFTYSHWKSEEALEKYRQSALFKEFWSIAKPCFIEKAEAWSVNKILES